MSPHILLNMIALCLHGRDNADFNHGFRLGAEPDEHGFAYNADEQWLQGWWQLYPDERYWALYVWTEQGGLDVEGNCNLMDAPLTDLRCSRAHRTGIPADERGLSYWLKNKAFFEALDRVA